MRSTFKLGLTLMLGLGLISLGTQQAQASGHMTQDLVKITKSGSASAPGSGGGGSINHNPTFDPLSSHVLELNPIVSQPRFVSVGVTDIDNDTMSLTINGSNVQGYQIVNNVAGRIEAVVELKPSLSAGVSYVTYTAKDLSGLTTTASVGIYTHDYSLPNAEEQPFMPMVFHQISPVMNCQINQVCSIPVMVNMGPSFQPSLTASLPANASLETTVVNHSNNAGVITGRIDFTPAEWQAGSIQEITLFARQKNMMAEAIINVDVTNPPPPSESANYAPVFDPLSMFMFGKIGESISVNVGATDINNDNMTLSISGVGVKNYQVTNNVPGRIEATVELKPGFSSLSSLTYRVWDGKGLSTTAQPLLWTGNDGPFNIPIIFNSLKSVTLIKSGVKTPLAINTSMLGQDDLNLVASLPANATLQTTNDKPGLLTSIVEFTPAPWQAGTFQNMLFNVRGVNSFNESSAMVKAYVYQDITMVPLAILKAAKVPTFLRGDANGDGRIDGVSDGTYINNWLFLGSVPRPPCMDAADVNDDGKVTIADSQCVLQAMYTGTCTIKAPYPKVGPDPTDDTLDCATSTPVCGDGRRNGVEACDGTDLAGQTCANLGFRSGTLKCTSACQISTTSCVK